MPPVSVKNQKESHDTLKLRYCEEGWFIKGLFTKMRELRDAPWGVQEPGSGCNGKALFLVSKKEREGEVIGAWSVVSLFPWCHQ